MRTTDGRRVAQHRIDTFIAGATQRDRKRNRNEPGLQCAQKRDDVVQSLRRQYHRAITGRPAKSELACNVQRSPIQLRPRQAFGNAGPVLLVINERECRVIGLQTGTLAQQGRKRCFDHRMRLPSSAPQIVNVWAPPPAKSRLGNGSQHSPIPAAPAYYIPRCHTAR